MEYIPWYIKHLNEVRKSNQCKKINVKKINKITTQTNLYLSDINKSY